MIARHTRWVLVLLASLPLLAHAARARDPARTLGQYHWQLNSATERDGHRLDALLAHPDKPLQLDFADGRMRISHACNAISGSYHVDGSHLVVGALTHTMMFCADKALMAMERSASEQLQGRLDFTLHHHGTHVQLRLVTADGDTLSFAGLPTAQTRYGSSGQTQFLEVASQTVPCTASAMAGKPCLSVRQRHYAANGLSAGDPGPWHALAQPIDGYTHQPGVRNVLRVKRYAIAHPSPGQPDHAYVLDMVVETHAPSAGDARR
jgi:heat shock protein HslJ